MDKHGIGTDATHAEHIETIQQRSDVCKHGDRFLPTFLGLSLYDAYLQIRPDMTRPELRAALERDLQSICDGRKNPHAVLNERIQQYDNIYRIAANQVQTIEEQLAINWINAPNGDIKSPCPLPQHFLHLISNRA